MHVDVIVIGGGPAGAVVAKQLAELNFQVCLIERKAFPRSHVGESMPPSLRPLLGSIGLLGRIEAAGFPPCGAPEIRWSGVSERDFSEVQDYGCQVDRAVFDNILLDSAKSAGCRVLQPAIVTSCRRASRQRWVLELESREAKELTARFLVDASGRSGFLREGQRHIHGPRTLALFAYWRNHHVTAFNTRVEAGRDCWFWGAPLGTGLLNATVFVDATVLRAGHKRGNVDLYRRLIGDSKLLRACLAGTRVGPVRFCDATPQSTAPSAGFDWCKVGEAAFAFDPLSSQGVQAAITSACRAAAVVNTLLTQPDCSDLAIDFYSSRQRQTMETHVQTCREMYHRQWQVTGREFWAARSWAARSPGDAPAPSSSPRLIEATDMIKPSAGLEFIETGVLRDNRIAPTIAVTAKGLPEPIAFVGDVEIAPLFEGWDQPVHAVTLLRRWSKYLRPKDALAVFQQLHNLGFFSVESTADERALASRKYDNASAQVLL